MKRVRLLLIAALATFALTAPATVAAVQATTCEGTLSGGTYHSIIVESGATCRLDDVTVTHSVFVRPGGSLYAVDSTIRQQVQSRGATTVRLIDTDVFGQIHIRRTTGRVLIGASSCFVDPIAGGNIHLHHNFGPITVCQMTIRNNLLVQNNQGKIRLLFNDVGRNVNITGNQGSLIRVRGNEIEGNLNCHQNAVTPTLVGNTVGGQRLGQCA